MCSVYCIPNPKSPQTRSIYKKFSTSSVKRAGLKMLKRPNDRHNMHTCHTGLV